MSVGFIRRTLYRTICIWNGIKDHRNSWWNRQFLGSVGQGTVIRAYSQLQGDCLEHVFIDENCDIDRNFVLGCDKRIKEYDEIIIPEIRIGKGCIIGQYNHFTAVRKITIGDNVLTGRFVLITDNAHGKLDFAEMQNHPSCRQVVSKGEVVIGNNVWLGDKVSVLPGVHIGDGCIVGANSVVTKDIPPYSIAVGIPAKVVRTIGQKEP